MLVFKVVIVLGGSLSALRIPLVGMKMEGMKKEERKIKGKIIFPYLVQERKQEGKKTM